ARRPRRDGDPALLLVAAAARRRARTRLVRVVRRQRHLQERLRPARRGPTGARRPPTRRDRQPVPRSAGRARPAQRAGVRRAHLRVPVRAARAGRDRADRRERVGRVRPPVMSVQPRKDLGQHFLVDENIVRVIGGLAELAPGDVVLEIGPGLGILTRFLAERVAHVHAIELDTRLAGELAGIERTTIHWGDALAIDATAFEPPPRKLVANLPYNVATPIVAESLRVAQLERWCVMVQREVADRFFAGSSTKAYGAVSVLVRLAAERTGFHAVSREVFRPRPNVDSALIAFRRIAPGAAPEVRRVVEAAFAHRRKTLANSLALAGVAPRERTAGALAAIGRRADVRAEALEPPEFVALTEALRCTPPPRRRSIWRASLGRARRAPTGTSC